jgi:hypothetical protein
VIVEAGDGATTVEDSVGTVLPTMHAGALRLGCRPDVPPRPPLGVACLLVIAGS